VGFAILRKPAISLKRGKIGPRSLSMINRKSDTRFRLVPKSTTLDDLERPLRTLFQNACIFRNPPRKSEYVDFRAFGRYRIRHLRKWGENYYIVLFSALSPFHFPKMHDLERPFYVQFLIFTLTNRVLAIRLHIYRKAIYRIFLLYDVTTMRKRTVKTAVRRILRILKGLRIFRRRKVAGATSSEP